MPDTRLRILLVCTANVCRSPLAAMLLDRALLDRSIDAIVESAGFLTEDVPVCATMREFAESDGLDLSFHRSRKVDQWLVGGADLVLTMERAHARDLMTTFDAPMARVFTVRGLLAHAQACPPQGEGLRRWLDDLAAHRTPMEFMGSRCDDDVIDPHGHSRRVHRRTFDQLVSAMDAVAGTIVEAGR